VYILKRQHDTRQRDEHDSQPHAPADRLMKGYQSDHRGGDDLGVVEQRGRGRSGPRKPQHQQDRGGDIQNDHRHHVGGVFAGDPGLCACLAIPGTDEVHREHAQACTEIEQRRQQRRRYGDQQQFGGWRAETIERGCQQGQGNWPTLFVPCDGAFAVCLHGFLPPCKSMPRLSRPVTAMRAARQRAPR